MELTKKTRNAAAGVVSVLLVYAVWARSGVYPPFQPFMVLLSAVLAILPLWLHREPFLVLYKALKRDPVFLAGGLFILLLTVQWINTGYTVLHNADGKVWMEPQPPVWMPWSMSQDSGAQMLMWFVPAWILLLTVRHVLESSGVRQVLYTVVWSSTLCAGIGIVQYLAEAPRMLWMWKLSGCSFFSTFGYVNHAAAFFYMNAAVAAGLVHDGVVRAKPPVQIMVWTVCALLNLIAAFLTLSRAGALGGMVVTAAAAIVLIYTRRGRLRSTEFLPSVLTALLIFLTGCVLFFGAGRGRLFQEFRHMEWNPQGVAGALHSRTALIPPARAVFRDYPVFGTGGWGYRWLAKAHIPMEEWRDWREPGSANVHCDPLQFLTEFGLFGMVCAGTVLGVLVFQAMSGGYRRPLFFWVSGALILIFLHSLIDLPFRCPAILFEWCFLLSALPFWRQPLKMASPAKNKRPAP